MSENTALWDKLGKTDPAHTKKFKRAGGFSGTAIKPMWSYRRLTEEFGPCGTGWGVEKPDYNVVPGHGGEVLVYCTVSGWYLRGDEKKYVYGVGGDKVVTYIKANEEYKRPERWENDDEAFKKAFTDALTNAFKFIGVGADVHMGMFDDSKYVNTIAREFSGEEAQKSSPKPKSQSRELYSSLENQMRSMTSTRDLADWWRDNECREKRASMPEDWQRELHEEFKAFGAGLKAGEDKLKSISDREVIQSPMAGG